MKIGIMGGTFDPIHIGHLLLGEFAYENFHLDEIWFLPNGNPPHKTTDESGVSLDDRIEMVKLATDDVPYFRLNLYEASSKKHSYTYSTMRALREMYPEHEFFFHTRRGLTVFHRAVEKLPRDFPLLHDPRGNAGRQRHGEYAGSDPVSERKIRGGYPASAGASCGDFFDNNTQESREWPEHPLYGAGRCIRIHSKQCSL